MNRPTSWQVAMAFLFAWTMAVADPVQADLEAYVKKPEAAYAWKLERKTTGQDGTVYELSLVTQVWQGITWKHQLQVYQPRGVAPATTMLLWNTGGSANARTIALGNELARHGK